MRLVLLVIFVVLSSTVHAFELNPVTPVAVTSRSVDNMGNFDYRIPIDLPLARNDFGPEFSIVYSPVLRQGPIGLGWTLSFEEIMVSPKRAPLYAESDRFSSSVHGPLVSLGDGFYQPEVSVGYFLYRKVGEDWFMWNANGQRKRFRPSIRNGRAIAKWSISTSWDSNCPSLNCNRVEYSYSRTNQLQEVAYNTVDGEGQTIVRFVYEERPDPTESYRYGFLKRLEERLGFIEIFHAGKLTSQFRFEYAESLISQLESVTRESPNGQSYPATVFEFQDSNRRDSEDLPLRLESGAPVRIGAGGYQILFADVNGDGLVDIYYHQNGRPFVQLGRRNSSSGEFRFALGQPMQTPVPLPGLNSKHIYFSDAQGDGLLDLYLLGSGDGTQLFLNKVSHFEKADVEGLNLNFNPARKSVFAKDINYDGRTDYVDLVSEGCRVQTESGEFKVEDAVSLGEPSLSAFVGRLFAADFNGDGLEDFAALNGLNDVLVWPSLGRCEWGQAKVYRSASELTSYQHPRARFFVADMNGDSQVEMIASSGSHVEIFAITSDQRLERRQQIQLTGAPRTIQVIDLDGDQIAEIVYCNSRECRQVKEVFAKPRLLTRIISPLGLKTEVNFEPLSHFEQTDWSRSTPFGFFVLTSRRDSDGLDLDRVKTYDYKNLAFDSIRRENTGFEWVYEHEPVSFDEDRRVTPPQITTTRYQQELMQAPNDVLAKAKNGRLVLRDRNKKQVIEQLWEWQVVDPGFARLQKETRYQYESQGVRKVGAITVNEYDIWGQIIRQSEYLIGDDTPNKVTRWDYRTFASGERSTFKSLDSAHARRMTEKLVSDSDARPLESVKIQHSNGLIGQIETQVEQTCHGDTSTTRLLYHDRFSLQVERITDGDGELITEQGWDELGLTQNVVTNGEGEINLQMIDAATGLPLWSKDPNGLETAYSYDDFDRLTGVRTTKAGIWQSSEYRSHDFSVFGRAGWVLSTRNMDETGTRKTWSREDVSPDGFLMARFVSGPGDAQRMVLARKRTTQGALAWQSSEPVAVVRADLGERRGMFAKELYQYDGLQRLTRTTKTSNGRTLETAFDLVDCSAGTCLRTNIKDAYEIQNETHTLTDGLGRLVEKTYVNSSDEDRSFRYTHSKGGQTWVMRTPESKSRTVEFDASGRVCQIEDTEFGKVRNTFDQRGRLSLRSWNQIEYTYEYDRADRVTSQLASGPGRYSQVLRYQYGEDAAINGIGRLVRAEYLGGSVRFEYSPLGLETRRLRYFESTGDSYSLEREYNGLGNLIWQRAEDLEFRWVYDGSGYLNSAPGLIEQVGYTSEGYPNFIAYENGDRQKTTYYPGEPWIAEIDLLTQGSQHQIRYERSQIGILKSQNYNGDIQDYGYLDSEATYFLSSSIGTLTDSGRYDYSREGRISNRASRNTYGQIEAYGDARYSFDFFSRLSVAEKASQRVTYTYGEADQLTQRTLGDGSWQRFIAPDVMVNDQGEFTFAIKMGHKSVGLVSSQKGASPLFTDQMSSVIGRSGEEISVYGPWGESRAPNNGFELGYASGRDDGRAGTVYLGRRMYSPHAKEFLSPDPFVIEQPNRFVEDPIQLNGFSYAKNSPLMFIDPTGGYSQAVFEGYMEAGLTDLGHYVKYQAISAYEFVAGVGDSEVTGIGLKPSGHVGVFEATARFGVDYIRGLEAFGEMSYRLGAWKGTGQLGYSNGGLRAIGRVERGGRNTAVGYTFGTAENLRAKTRLGPLSLQYNSDLSGRIDLKVGKAYGIDLEVYGNINLTPDSLEHFDQSRTYSDWSFRGMPYGGAAW